MFCRCTWNGNTLGKIVLGITILGLHLCWPETVYAQSSELMQAYRQGLAFRNEGRHEEAIPFFQKALELGEQELGPDHKTTAILLSNLAVIYKIQGRYSDAEPLFRRSLAIRKKALGDHHPDIATSLNNLAVVYDYQGRYADAEPLYMQSLAIRKKALGPEHPNVAAGLNNIAVLYFKQGRYSDAEPLYKQSLAIWEKALGPENANVTSSLNNLAALYKIQGHYAEAEPLYKRSLAIGEKVLGHQHPDVATSLNGLASLYSIQGHFADAESLYRRSLAIGEKALGPQHPDIATSLNGLALLYADQGRYADAEPLYQRSLAIREKALGPEHPDVATSLNDLASLFDDQARYADAEPLLRRSLAIREKTLGPEHLQVARSLNDLAVLYEEQARYADAEPLHKRSLVIRKQALGPQHPDVATSLNNLALLYGKQGRFGDAESIFKRSLAIWEKALGPEHLYVATNLNNLAMLYRAQNRPGDAEPLYKRSLAIREMALEPDNPDLALSLNNLAGLYLDQGRYADAEPLYERSLAIREKALNPQHPVVAESLNNLASLYAKQGRYGEAESLFKRSLAIFEKAQGPQHPDVASSLSNLAWLRNLQGQKSEELDYRRRSTAIRQARAFRSGGRTVGGLSEQKSVRSVFTSHVSTAIAVGWKEPSRRDSLTAETFSVGQLARATQTGAAVSRMAARFAAGNDDLAQIVRDHQDAVALWQKLDEDLIQVISAPPDKRIPTHEQTLRERLDDLDARIGGLSKKLATAFPGYVELAAAKPVPLDNIQKLLAPEEALVAYLVSNKKTFVWAVRRERTAIFVADVGQVDLQDAVVELRGGLDASGVNQLSDLRPFNRVAAHTLFNQIFAPAERALEGARHVFVVADGALQSLPLGVLLTDQPKGDFKDFADYRHLPWLAKKYALTTLPSVSSLQALRRFTKRAKAHIPFTGFGDPLLNGHPGSKRGIKLASLYRGAIANVDAVRDLPPLPDTADELRALSTAVNGDGAHIFLREAATEEAVKSMDLSNSRIVTFATHGLVAGDLKNAEPALVLSPPELGSALDDGLLTASEVAQLKLNADLVILSACNTAAGDDADGAEGLSGLAKAFFYAGSRALLVSHWPVVSEAAVKLTTGMLGYRANNPTSGRAEALRQSMLALMNDVEKPYYAHPLFWAPFVVVGEGGVHAAK